MSQDFVSFHETYIIMVARHDISYAVLLVIEEGPWSNFSLLSVLSRAPPSDSSSTGLGLHNVFLDR
jgi:hypothetical protein